MRDGDDERAERIEQNFRRRRTDVDLSYPAREAHRPRPPRTLPPVIALWTRRLWPFVVAACVILSAFAGCALSLYRAGQSNGRDDYTAALIAAHTRHRIELEHMRDSLKIVASSARIVYREYRKQARDLSRELPPVTLKGDTLTIHDSTYTLPRPVAVYIADLRSTVAAQDAALVKADTAVVLTQKVAAASDSVTVASQVETQDQQALNRPPGLLGRVWRTVKVPLAFVGGVALGVALSR